MAQGEETGDVRATVGPALFYVLATFSIALQVFLLKTSTELVWFHVRLWQKNVATGRKYTTLNWNGKEFQSLTRTRPLTLTLTFTLTQGVSIRAPGRAGGECALELGPPGLSQRRAA